MIKVSWVLCIVEVKDPKTVQSKDDIFIVLTKNGEAKERKNIWQLQLPGGGKDCHESFIVCAKRELYEELGLSIEENNLSYIWDDIFEIQWYQSEKIIEITVHLIYACITSEKFEKIKNFRSEETRDIVLHNILEYQEEGKNFRPWTLSHIQRFLQQYRKETTWEY